MLLKFISLKDKMTLPWPFALYFSLRFKPLIPTDPFDKKRFIEQWKTNAWKLLSYVAMHIYQHFNKRFWKQMFIYSGSFLCKMHVTFCSFCYRHHDTTILQHCFIVTPSCVDACTNICIMYISSITSALFWL